ncbi:3-deoxy-manno-octulosonate cytidylyltransferase [Sphingomonas sp. PR090111-T3T-6A]|uniref:3-deoxy-manno-octulosonate cytidylyltransferase n=1 Tax=Sphingomonas sp. PR090111-T3T-6A TaxID=685778 RepID=UPI0003780D29|nr:3-deoxy-manno-octulosonate cytidylyltransferase [Sphingomonas sp. PR090111-T3T-6A]
MTSRTDLIVVPARFGSKRLPGKPLVRIAGRTLLERVVHVAREASRVAGDIDILVATDDPRIEAHARDLGCAAVMTASDISSGSGRAYAAALSREVRPEIVVNLQGDAPFMPPEVVAQLIEAVRASSTAAATPVTRMGWAELDRLRDHKTRAPFSGTTCVRAPDGRALWFSKAIIPAIRDEAERRKQSPQSPVFQHLGLYAYRFDALERFEQTPLSHYEQIEGLEQLRFLEMGLDILTVEVAPPRFAVSGIDTPEDVALAETLIAELGDPYRA